jgi:hypothetical protein
MPFHKPGQASDCLLLLAREQTQQWIKDEVNNTIRGPLLFATLFKRIQHWINDKMGITEKGVQPLVHAGTVLRPTQFEVLGGKGANRHWKQSLRLVQVGVPVSTAVLLALQWAPLVTIRSTQGSLRFLQIGDLNLHNFPLLFDAFVHTLPRR